MSAARPEPASRPFPRSICYVTAVPITVRAFLTGHIRAAAERAPVTVVTGVEDPGFLRELGLAAALERIAIVRPISPWRDLLALAALWRLFRRARFALVHSVTPKAGLLAMLGARLAGVPLRVHIFTGQVWATRTGLARRILRAADRLLAASATHLLADSATQRDFLVAEGVAPAAKILVLGAGSISGVDAGRFRPDPAARETVRRTLGIDAAAVVFVFVGRLTREKGLPELLAAFAGLSSQGTPPAGARLLLVGPDEEGLLASALPEGVSSVGFTTEPERYLAAGDIFVLPSHREGFGTSVIEAAAAGLPAIATRIYGLTDAVVEGATGLLVPPRDPAALARAMNSLLADSALRERLGRAARARALADFSRERITAEWMAFYGKIADH